MCDKTGQLHNKKYWTGMIPETEIIWNDVFKSSVKSWQETAAVDAINIESLYTNNQIIESDVLYSNTVKRERLWTF